MFKKIFQSIFLLYTLIITVSCISNSELEWNEEDRYRWAEINPGLLGATGFKKLSSSDTGITFKNTVRDELIAQNRHYLNGSGVAVGDINGNGLVDIYFANLEGPNRLYKNLGNYQFQDITEEAGLAHEAYNSTGVVFADLIGNGFLDLVVTSLDKGNTIYINDGEGRFKVNNESGLGESRGSKTVTLADVNRNGYLDLYITNYKVQSIRDIYSREELSPENTIEIRNGELVMPPVFDEHFDFIETEDGLTRVEVGEKDELYINLGEGIFEKADEVNIFFDEKGNSQGLSRDWGLTATFRDVTGNLLPDLYVANDFSTPDRLWINQGDGTFKSVGNLSLRNMSFSSMGVDFSDINRNGHLDFVVTEMLSTKHEMRMRQLSQNMIRLDGLALYNRNSVYLNRGDTTFSQIAYYSGLEASDWSWATSFLDVNLNGYEDLIVATGFGRDYQDMDTHIKMYENNTEIVQGGGDIVEYPELKLTNKIFKNNGDLKFIDMSKEWGFDVEDISLGMAFADLNNDGDLDIIINRFNEKATIYENRTKAPRIAVRLKGNRPNTQGIGAKVELYGGPVYQSKEMIAGGNYLSGSQTQIVFAAKGRRADHIIKVTWPSGKKSIIEEVKANRIYEINETGAVAVKRSDAKGDTKPLFKDESLRLNHYHHENVYNDFRYGPLLPLRLSRLGPGVTWIDYNNNGKDDLLITTGRDGHLALFKNTGGGNFIPVKKDPLTGKAPGDQTAIIGWKENDITRLVVGNANYEQGDPQVPSAFIYEIDQNNEIELIEIPGLLSTTGPLAAADYSGNNYLDLFVGGRHLPGQYPRNADSRLFKNLNGSFVLDERNSRLLSEVGLVTDALFFDFNQSGLQDLLISTEWGTLKLFENIDGNFREVTEQVGLSEYKGWWNGIATGDFNNNGLPDIVALNLGLNSAYQIRNDYPLKMFYDDFNWDQRLNILESYFDKELNAYVPRRKLHDFESIPTILRHVSTHSEFAISSIEEIFDQSFVEVPFKELNTLEHMIFINNGNQFIANPLPVEAQLSTAFYAGIADFDNDGNEDLFLSQNFFSFAENTPRLDAGRGLVLKGNGKGDFISLSGMESGIKVYGEQRGASISDINQNGKADLVVSQNGGQTKLYMNQISKPGIRIRLNGPKENRMAIGSSIRLVYRDGNKGPRRMIQAGSGYFSQNSVVQVMGVDGEPDHIEVTWFDGTIKRVYVKLDILEYVISYLN